MKITKVFRKDLGEYRWKIDITVDGRRTRRADFEKKQDAIDAIAALLTTSRAVRYGLVTPQPKVTLKDLKEQCDKDRKLKAKRQTLRIFKEFVKLTKPTTELVDLTKAHWRAYVDSLEDRRCKPGTINRYLAEISSVLSSVPERFPDLGDWRPPQAPWLPEPSGRSRLLSKEEIGKLLAGLRAERQFRERDRGVSHRLEVYDLFRLMLLTGAREGELLNLKQSQVSWDWRTVNIIATKTKTTRVVPLSDSVLKILKARKIHAPRFFKKFDYHSLYNALERAATIAKVPYGDRVEGGWVLYDLRHVAGTVMENAGIPYSAVAAILGHKRRDQTATYAHAQLDTLRRGVEVLESWCREIDGFSALGCEFLRPAATSRKQA